MDVLKINRDEFSFDEIFETLDGEFWSVGDSETPYVSLAAILSRLHSEANHPDMRRLGDWVSLEFLPAIARHGHYAPENDHQPITVEETLDAIETKERHRDMLNNIQPELGDALADGNYDEAL